MDGEREANEGGSAAKLPPSLVGRVALAIKDSLGAVQGDYRPEARAAILAMIDDLRALMAQVDTEYAGYVRAIIHRWERG